ncbi:SAF domain-containing protein [Oryzobacter terrae]|uniref:SAF domain-containing protein n=1 Tax=Oryzobacter terrae TaxID=1620385 RepID=UPI00366BADC8
MAARPRPLPALLGRGRRARWWRTVVRRGIATALAAASVLLVLHELRPPPPAEVPVLLAARELPAGRVLAVHDLVRARAPARGAPPGAVVDPGDAVGRRLVAGLAPGEALTRTRLVPRGPADGLPARRVAVHVVAADPASVDLLRPGALARVYPAAGGRALASGALVLATDPPASAEVSAATVPVRGVVLALTAEEADAVVGGHGGLEGPVTVGIVAVGS